MPNKPVPWLKLWPELVDHEKFAQLTDSESWTWVKLLAKSGQQPTRGRFRDVNHAVVATGRPKKHVERLIEVRLLDQRADGLWMHDWEKWQRWRPEDGVNSDGSPPDQPPNGHPSTRDEHAMNNGSTHLRDKRIENRPEEITPTPSGKAPRLRVVGEPCPKPITKPNPVKTLIDKIRALDPAVEVFGDQGFTGKKLKENPDANLDLIAAAYVSFRHGEWPGSKMLRETGALAWVVGDVGGYVTWRNSRRPSTPRFVDRTGVAN
jgi:hypothetical protein